MDAHDRAVDHLHLAVVRLDDSIHQAIPNTCLAPAVEAIVGARVGESQGSRSAARSPTPPRGCRIRSRAWPSVRFAHGRRACDKSSCHVLPTRGRKLLIISYANSFRGHIHDTAAAAAGWRRWTGA